MARLNTKLVLFDIDGTLIHSAGVGRDSVTQAFDEVCSVRDAFKFINMAGKTDIQIIREALTVHELPSDDGIIPNILSRYIRILKTEISNHDVCINPGVIELLDYLNKIKGFSVGLLTGNIEEGGRIKLGRIDLNRYFHFGAFGDDHEDRNNLLPIAIKKFRDMTHVDIPYRDCIVIGDTPRDVECARIYNAVSIAVSTGPFTYDDLMGTGADYVLQNLTHAQDLRLFH